MIMMESRVLNTVLDVQQKACLHVIDGELLSQLVRTIDIQGAEEGRANVKVAIKEALLVALLLNHHTRLRRGAE